MLVCPWNAQKRRYRSHRRPKKLTFCLISLGGWLTSLDSSMEETSWLPFELILLLIFLLYTVGLDFCSTSQLQRLYKPRNGIVDTDIEPLFHMLDCKIRRVGANLSSFWRTAPGHSCETLHWICQKAWEHNAPNNNDRYWGYSTIQLWRVTWPPWGTSTS